MATLRYVDGSWSDPFPDLDSDQTMVIAFAAPSYAERPDLFAALSTAYPHAAVIGCSTSGELDRTRIRDESITVAVVQFERTRVRRAQAPIENAEHSFAAGGVLAEQLASKDGLGLVFCRLAAEAHGGRIWVEARQPTGATFCVRIPQPT